VSTDPPDRLDRWIPRLMVATILAVAAFAFVQSYTHVFFLGQTHHQTGASLRMLPLSVDWVMFAAGLAMLHLGRKGIRHPLPRATLLLGATATLIANIAFGIVFGWETAVISSWAPVALFVVVELGMLLVRTARAKPEVSHAEVGQLAAGGSHRRNARPDMDSSHAVGATPTALRASQGTHDPSPETATFPRQVDSPEPALEGWGPANGKPGLTGIGLRNREG
jgi:hypothetical protein